MRNLNVVGNTLSGTDEDGAGVYLSSSDVPSWSFNNVYDNDGDAFYGLDDPTGSDGNLAVDPLYSDTSSSDPTAWDLSLQSGSPVMDAGDPDLSDDDGSTSDLGAYGGPDGTSW